MERKFTLAWAAAREKAWALGVRMRPVEEGKALETAHKTLSGSRFSDGFRELARMEHLELSLEALAVNPRFTALFTDEEANTALTRLLEAGYGWKR